MQMLEFEVIRILVIDGDELAMKGWERALGGRATLERVGTFESAWERTSACSWRERPCDCAFVSPQLPDGDGIELLNRLAVLAPRPAVAVLSTGLSARDMLAVHGRCVIAAPKPVSGEVVDGILTVLETARSGAPAVERFARRFRLSPQETRLVLVAAGECTNDEAAEQLGCSPSTVRSYWARVFQKTGRRSARDVLALLFRFTLDPSEQQPGKSA
jgi:DNA-binding NarL/FixJ family response regulator